MTIQSLIRPLTTATTPPTSAAARRRTRTLRRMTTLLVALIVAVQIYPLVWVLLTSLRPAQEFAGGDPFALPSALTADNFRRAWQLADLPRYITNSAVVTLASNLLIVALGMMAAYAIQVLRFRLSRLVLGVFLIGIIVPVQVALVPLFINYSRVGLLDTYASMIVPLVGFALPVSVYLFTSFFEYIPSSTYEAAVLDGAGPYRVFFQITLPLSVNTIVTVVFVNSIFIWNDFILLNRAIIYGLESGASKG